MEGYSVITTTFETDNSEISTKSITIGQYTVNESNNNCPRLVRSESIQWWVQNGRLNLPFIKG